VERKVKVPDIIAIVLIWLIALSLLYVFLVKVKLLK